jgi:hypothetical protein
VRATVNRFRPTGVEGGLHSWPRRAVNLDSQACSSTSIPGVRSGVDSASWRTAVWRAPSVPLRGRHPRFSGVEAGRRRQEDCGGERASDGVRTADPSSLLVEARAVPFLTSNPSQGWGGLVLHRPVPPAVGGGGRVWAGD